MTKTLDASLR